VNASPFTWAGQPSSRNWPAICSSVGASVTRAAIGVDGQFAEERAVLADDSNLGAGHKEADHAVSVGGADADVAQAAEAAEGDGAAAVDAVMAGTRYWTLVSSVAGPALTRAAKAVAGVRAFSARCGRDRL